MSETTLKHKAEAPKKLNFAIIVCSSARYEALKTKKDVNDLSGELILKAIKRANHNVIFKKILPDDLNTIRQTVKDTLSLKEVDVVIICGGTGISPKDVTIEAVQPLLEKNLDGFGEILRRLSFEEIGSAAILTRAIGGVTNGKAIFCIPGSPQAANLAIEKLILPEASHIIKHARE